MGETRERAYSAAEVPKVDSNNLLSLFKETMPAVDANKDQKLTPAEIKWAAQTQNMSPGQSLLMVALVNNFHELGTKDQVTELDMRRYDGVQSRVTRELADVRQAIGFASRNFRAMDKDENGFLTITEINEFATGKNDLTTFESCNFLKNHFKDVQKASNDEWFFDNDGLSGNDIRAYQRKFEESKDSRLVAKINEQLDTGRKRLLSVNGDLFADMQNPAGSIHAEWMDAGTANDANFVSWMKQVAKGDPAAIVNSIKENDDGTFTVTVPDFMPIRDPHKFSTDSDRPLTHTGGERQVVVPRPTTTELAMFDNSAGNGIWPAVLTKAWGRYLNRISAEKSYFFGSSCSKFRTRDDEQLAQDVHERRYRGSGTAYKWEPMDMQAVATYSKIELRPRNTGNPLLSADLWDGSLTNATQPTLRLNYEQNIGIPEWPLSR